VADRHSVEASSSHTGSGVCKNGAAGCGISWDCGACTRELHEKIWRNMTPEQRAYDRMVDPLGAYTSGISAPGGDDFMYERECTCHIAPPCSYCVDKSRDEAESDEERT